MQTHLYYLSMILYGNTTNKHFLPFSLGQGAKIKKNFLGLASSAHSDLTDNSKMTAIEPRTQQKGVKCKTSQNIRINAKLHKRYEVVLHY